MNIERIGRWTTPPTILLAGLVLSVFLVALGGFWISHAFGLSISPPDYSVRAVVFALIGTTFCLLDATGRYGWSFASAFLLLTLVGSGVLEFVGIKTGAIFGPYYYNPAIPAQLFGILPVVVPCGWFVFSYFSFATVDSLLRKNAPPVLRATLATALVVAYDLTSDPNQASRAVWTYPDGGIYYGVPLQNFIAWTVFGFVAMVVLQFVRRAKAIVSEEEIILPLPAIAYSAIIIHEAIFALVVTKAPICAAIGLVVGAAVLVILFLQTSKKHDSASKA